ncbi:MAG TPA: glycosyltransferase family 4 protein [Planctomycetota bacterium]|nr:glycosyltransferase family 4 protein [Planctomycetota bacterium]
MTDHRPKTPSSTMAFNTAQQTMLAAARGSGGRSKRILMVLPDLIPSEETAYAIDLALTLDSHGHAVRLICGDGVWQNLLSAHQLDFQIMPEALQGLRSPLFVRRALKSLDTYGAEVVIGFETGSLRLLNLIAHLRKIPQVLAFARAFDPIHHPGAPKIRLNRAVGGVIVPIQAMREILVNHYGIPAGLCEVVPPCADSRMALSGPSEVESLWVERMPGFIFQRPDPNPYAESDGAVLKEDTPETRDDETRRLTVATAGRLMNDRGLEIFIALVSELALKRPGIDFVIFGGGPDEAKLRKRIETLGLTARLLIVASPASWPALFPSIDVFVWSSDEAGGEIPAVYAMGAGKPIVAVRGTSSLELCGEEEVALLTEVNEEQLRIQKADGSRSHKQIQDARRRLGSLQVEGLKKTLAQVLANRGMAEKMGQQAKRHALKVFSRTRQYEELAQILARFEKKAEVAV